MTNRLRTGGFADLGFGLVGCGRIADRHAAILAGSAVPGAKLVAVCDPQRDRAKRLGERYGVPYFASADAMLSGAGAAIDVLSILTPSGTHAEICVGLAPHGCHMVVEKPMALTLDDADAMIAACDAAGVKLFVVKQNRFNRPVAMLRRAFEEGRFGRIVMGTARVWWRRDQAYYDQDAWRGTWALDGGVFANQASHHIDLLEWFLGEPMVVYATGRTALVDIETEDTGVAVIQFRGGAIGVVEATVAARPDNLEGSFALLGERGTVEVGGFAVNQVSTWRFDPAQPEDADAVAMGRTDPPDVYGFGHVAYLCNVVDAIRNRRVALVDGLEGRRSLELILAIYESMATGMPVEVRFQQRKSRLGLR